MAYLDSLADWKNFSMNWDFLFKLGFFTKAIIMFSVLGAIAWFWFFLIKHNIQVIIFEKRGGGVIKIRSDKAAKLVNKQTGVVSFRLLKSRLLFPPPEKNNQIYTIGKKDLLLLEERDKKLYPIKIEDIEKFDPDKEASLKFQGIPQDVQLWAFLRMQQSLTVYSPKNKLAAMLPVLLQFGGFALVFVCFYILLYEIKKGLTVTVQGQCFAAPATIPTMTNPNP